MMRTALTLVALAVATLTITPAAGAQTAPTNRQLAHHHATAEVVQWAFDQHRFALYGDTRRLVGYRLGGCNRAAPGRFRCTVAIGVVYGTTVFEHSAPVVVRFRRGQVAVRRLRSTVSIGEAATFALTL